MIFVPRLGPDLLSRGDPENEAYELASLASRDPVPTPAGLDPGQRRRQR